MTIQTPLTQIWYTRCPVPTPVGLAAQLGLLDAGFARDGILLRSIADDADPKIRESHFTHSLPWSFRHGGNVPPIRARSEGVATRLVGITWTDEFQAILALPESGIRTVRDLAGRRFGVPRRPAGIVDFMAATALKGLESALSLDGVPEDQVRIVDIALDRSVNEERFTPDLYGLRGRHPYAAEIIALVRGEVDAIYVKGTGGISAANLLAAHTVAEFGFHPDPKIRINSGSPRVLTVDERLAEDRPDLVVRLLSVLAEAGRWAEAHPDDARRFVARESGASEEAVAAANGPGLHRHLGIGLDPDLVAAIGHYKDFLFRRGFLAADFSLEDWIDRRPFDALNAQGGA